MNELWTLRDIDNRGDDGEPWETTGTPADLAAYIDGPLLSDLTNPTDAEEDLREIADRMRKGTWDGYDRRLLQHLGVYIREADDSDE